MAGSGNNRALEHTIPLQIHQLNDYRLDDLETEAVLLCLWSFQEQLTRIRPCCYSDKRDPNGTGFEQPISPILEAFDTFVNPYMFKQTRLFTSMVMTLLRCFTETLPTLTTSLILLVESGKTRHCLERYKWSL